MSMFAYLRWRLSPQGKAAYRLYAQGRAEAARLVDAPLRVAQVTDVYRGGRVRTTDFDRAGRKTRVHETRIRAKGPDGLRPRQRRTR